MHKFLRSFGAAIFAVVAVMALVGCGDSDDDDNGNGGGGETTTTSGGGETTTTSGGGETTTSAAASGPTIDSFSVEGTVSCSGDTADVRAEWSTSGAESVSFAVDGEAVPADAGQPLSGEGNIPVPCDGSSHEIELTASGSGGQDATDTQTVSTESGS